MASTLLQLTDSVHVHPDVVWRDIDGEVVILHLVSGLYYGLDAPGASFWRLVAGATVTLESVRERLAAEYAGDPAAIERDVLELADRLVRAQLLVPAPGAGGPRA